MQSDGSDTADARGRIGAQTARPSLPVPRSTLKTFERVASSGSVGAIKRSRFTEEQMVTMLRDADRRPVTAMVKQLVSSQTIYGWRVTARAAPAWKADHGDNRRIFGERTGIRR